MVRWRTFKKLFLLLLVLSLSLVSQKAYGKEVAYQGQISLHGHQARFPRVDDAYLIPGAAAFLEFAFAGGSKFDVRCLQFGVNGARARVSHHEMGLYARWQQRSTGWVLLVDVGKMTFEGGSFAKRVLQVQARNRQVRVWVTGPRRLAKAYIVFTPGVSAPARVVWDGSTPATLVTKRSVAFAFRSTEPTAVTECRLDSNKFTACTSPARYNSLSNGWHYFAVRAVSASGQKSPELGHSFYVLYTRPAVEITKTEPAESPTFQHSMSVQFRRNENWGTGSVTQCRIDNGAYQTCVSPARYDGLVKGDHKFEVRMALRTWGITWTSAADSYEWTIREDLPVAEWVKTPAALTNTATAEFEFRSNSPAAFECALDGAASSACESPLRLEGLASGVHTLVLVARDAAGNASPALEHRWQVDTDAPVVQWHSIMPQQNPTNLNRLTASFAVSEAASTQCRADGGAWAACTSPVALNDLADGEHVLEVTATDLAGNTSAVLSYTWMIDTTLPTVTIEMRQPTSLPTRDTAAVFHFVPSETATFLCELDGGAREACGVDVTFTGLAHGQHTLSVVPVDTAGNEGQVSQFEWAVDLIAPAVSLVAADPSESVTQNSSLSLAFAVSETAQTLCELDSAGEQACSSPFVVNGLVDGVHQIRVTARDLAGNTSAAFVYQWRVASPAYVSLTDISPAMDLTRETSASFGFLSAETELFECSLDGAAFAACVSPAAYQNLADGAHRFEVRAINAGGIAGPLVAHAWTIDTVAPVVTLVSVNPPEALTALTSITVTFTADSQSEFYCALDAAAAQPCTSPATFNGLSDGNHTLAITARDAAGNLSTAVTHAWRVQSAPLSVASVTVQQITRTTALIRWTTNFPAHGRVEYGLGNSFNLSTPDVLPDATAQSVQLVELTPNSAYRARVRVTDSAGRTAVSSAIQFSTLR